MDVLAHYGRVAQTWEVCLRVDSEKYHIDLGCSPPASPNELGGHLVALVERSFLVDASLGQLTDTHPDLIVPPAFVGELLPQGAPLRDCYEFRIPGVLLRYSSRPVSTNYKLLPDWGPSLERDTTRDRIISLIEAYCRRNGIEPPKAAT